MKFAKVRNVKSPSRGTDKASGLDFYVPAYSAEFASQLTDSSLNDPSIKELIDLNKRFIKRIDDQGFIVESLGRVFIPSGIKVCVPEEYDLVAHNKGGVATKKGLLYGAHVVDEDYTGEIFLSIFNVSPDPVTIEWDKKIIQLVLRKVNYENAEECTIEELETLFSNKQSTRGSGAVGSTGTN